MSSIFSKIVAGEIPCHKVAEDDRHLAFLDINPVAEGHTLVIPKKEVDYIFNLEEDDYAALMKFTRKVAAGLEEAIPCKRIGVAVIGLEVPHTHVHLVPISTEGDLSFTKPKLKLSHEELGKIAAKIAAKIN